MDRTQTKFELTDILSLSLKTMRKKKKWLTTGYLPPGSNHLVWLGHP